MTVNECLDWNMKGDLENKDNGKTILMDKFKLIKNLENKMNTPPKSSFNQTQVIEYTNSNFTTERKRDLSRNAPNQLQMTNYRSVSPNLIRADMAPYGLYPSGRKLDGQS